MKVSLPDLIKGGAVGVFATDTIYGIHCMALRKNVVHRIYEIRERNPKKPFIILISSLKDLDLFKIKLKGKTIEFLEKNWPNKVSVILPCPQKKFFYLHRGTDTLAFRLPKKDNLIKLLRETGPLISTSVNPEGLEPAYTISKAKKYFGKKLDFYIDEGKIRSEPSTLVKIDKNGNVETLRQGEIEIDP